MPHTRTIGRGFEDQAADYLASQGFTLITRRYSCKGGEIDLVALEGEIFVFVEVKGRITSQLPPEAAVTDRKRERIFKAAKMYLLAHSNQEREVRFDVIAIDREGIRHHRNAFQPE